MPVDQDWIGRPYRAMIGAEMSLARLEGLLSGDFRLARLWSSEAMISEAVCSVCLEDIQLRESDLLLRINSARAIDVDARGGEVANALIRLMRQPPDILGAPGQTLRRLEGVLRLRSSYRALEQDLPAAGMDAVAFSELIEEELAQATSPLTSAIRIAARYSDQTEGGYPAVERILIVFLDGIVRQKQEMLLSERANHDDDPISALARSARWVPIARPATAISMAGHSAWSLRSSDGVMRLLVALHENALRELGSIGVLRQWLARMDATCAGLSRRSRLPRLFDLVTEMPLLTSRHVSEELAVSRRGALNLIEEAVGCGMLRTITSRRSARVWGTPALADRFHSVPESGPTRPAARARHSVGAQSTQSHSIHPKAAQSKSRQNALDDALEALDRAMAEADAHILNSRQHQVSRRTNDEDDQSFD